MSLQSISLFLVSLVFVLSVVSCSNKQNPHLGETVTSNQLEEGVTITQSESRELLSNGKLAGQEAALLQIESVVFAIDYNTRIISLKNNEGKLFDVIAGPEVKNFKQIQAGDKVQVEYLVSVAFEVRKPTQEEILIASEQNAVAAAGKSKLGAKPAAAVVAAGLRIMNIDKIDSVRSVVVLKDVNSGEITDVAAKYPENLAYVRVGDSVVVTAVEAIAAKVSRVE